MIIDGDFLAPVLWALAGLVVGSLAGAVIIGVVCARLGRRELGCASVLMSWVLLISVGVVTVVLWRTKDGEATFYDWLWAVGLGALGWITARLLWRPRSIEARQSVP